MAAEVRQRDAMKAAYESTTEGLGGARKDGEKGGGKKPVRHTSEPKRERRTYRCSRQP